MMKHWNRNCLFCIHTYLNPRMGIFPQVNMCFCLKPQVVKMYVNGHLHPEFMEQQRDPCSNWR